MVVNFFRLKAMSPLIASGIQVTFFRRQKRQNLQRDFENRQYSAKEKKEKKEGGLFLAG